MSERHNRAILAILETVSRIEREVRELRSACKRPRTPNRITFQEITMAPATAGNTLVYTGTLAPSGAAFPTGTSFAVTSSDPTVSPTVDPTGLVVTIPLPSTFVDDPTNPLTITYSASGITPSPSDSPTSLSATITPTVPVAATPTPTGITFTQSE